MGFRTIVINSVCKLELQLNCLVCKGIDVREKRVFLSEISTLIIGTTAVSFTASLLCELVKNDISIIFCDEKHNPHSSVLPLNGGYNSSKRIMNQFAWTVEAKEAVWADIIKHKILRQADLLSRRAFNEQSEMLSKFVQEIAPNDSTNREGHAAKVYFNALFGMDFNRRNDDYRNVALNYGYAVLLSAVNREIVANGYITQLGVWHKNEFNDYNLGCDLMEPFRPIVDEAAVGIGVDAPFKLIMADILNTCVVIDSKKQFLDNAISVYCRSVFDALSQNDITLIKYYEL